MSDMTRRGWIQGVVASIASAAIVVKATPAETALVTLGAPAELLVEPEPSLLLADDLLPTFYVRTIDGAFEPFALATEMSMHTERIDFESRHGTREYVRGLTTIEGRFVVIGGIRRELDAKGRMHWGRARS